MGDRSKIVESFASNEKILFKWLIKILGDADSASDVTQSTFLNLWNYGDTASIDSAKALIFRTASNLAYNELRRRGRYQKKYLCRDDQMNENWISDLESPEASPEEQLCSREEAARVIEAIDRLPVKYRRAFKLHRFEECSYRDIAQRMGVSESSVEKYMIEALKRLREVID
ncbi:RNA polymerase sigma factor [Marinicaulis aureus]|uniref:RNA polymerase sigma factor n=1 Tax=Hyphococcus aureus TaxID=2666033 RepID=A0ABW1KTL3_9PROT